MEGSIFNFITTLLGLLGVGGIVSAVVIRRIDKMAKQQQDRDEARAQESVLIIRGLRAVGHLGEATAKAVKTGRANGDMDQAIKYHTEFKDDLNQYLYKQNAAMNHSGK